MSELERRYVELRATEGRTLAGVVMKYGALARIRSGYERFEARSFGNVEELDVLLSVQHDDRRILARTGGGGLLLIDTPESLEMTAQLPETREADDALTLVRAGIMRGLSVEFEAIRQRFENGVRIISRAALPGFSLVTRPAYQASSLSARAARDDDDARFRLWL